MGRKKIDRSDKIIQSFETTKPLRERLIKMAKARNMTVSALIREILEIYIEERK